MDDILPYLALGTGYALIDWGLKNTPSNQDSARNQFNSPSPNEVTPREPNLPANVKRWIRNLEEVAQGKSPDFFDGVPSEIVTEYELHGRDPYYDPYYG